MSIQLMITKGTAAETAASWGLSQYTVHPVSEHADGPGSTLHERYELIRFGEGRVLATREMNGYHDSDFYVTYMTDSGAIVEKQYATTRGWTYLNGAREDATDDLRLEWRAQIARAQEADRKWRAEQAEARRKELALQCKVSEEEIKKLVQAYAGQQGYFEQVVTLLKTNKFRSVFRKALCDQVRNWLKDPNPKYRQPLSAKQHYYI